jgi:hypothetical protein
MPPCPYRIAACLLVLAGSGLAQQTSPAAAPAAPDHPVRLPREMLRQMVQARTPSPAPAVETTSAPDTPPAAPADTAADVVLLPEMRVIEKPLPGDPDAWLTPKARREKAVKEYLNAMNPLERLLNGWHIPLLTPSVAVRAQSAYQEKKFTEEMNRIARIVDAVAAIDPKEAVKLRQEMRPYP